MSPPRLVVLGTDTGVGKTVVCALLARRVAARLATAYWKPVATGLPGDSDPESVRRLAGELVASGKLAILPEVYAFPEPVSPHLAARLAGAVIDPEVILGAFHEHLASAPDRALIVEGAGGLLVPLTDEGALLIDLVARFELPCLLVARSTLGTINHTLLSLEALGRRQIPVAGVILVGPPNGENRRAIERHGDVAVVAEIPHVPALDAQTAAELAVRIPENFLVQLS